MLLHFLLLKEGTHSVCPLTGGKEHRKPMHGFLQTLLVSFSLAEPVTYPFAVINLGCENPHILRAESPSSESWNMRMALGTCETFIINCLHRKISKQGKCP